MHTIVKKLTLKLKPLWKFNVKYKTLLYSFEKIMLRDKIFLKYKKKTFIHLPVNKINLEKNIAIEIVYNWFDLNQ